MTNAVRFQPLTHVESFSIAERFTKRMAELNHSVDRPKLGFLVSRVLGCTFVAFTAIADAFIHVALMVGKSVASLATLAFRLCFSVPRDLDPSSPIIHAMRSLQSIFNVFFLPFLCVNPDRAYRMTQTKEVMVISHKETVKENTPEASAAKENERIEKLNQEIQNSQNELNLCKSEIEVLRKGEEGAIQAKLAKEEEIEALNQQKKNLEEQVNIMKDNLPANQLENIRNLAKLEQQNEVNQSNQQIANLNGQIIDLQQQLTIAEKNFVDANTKVQQNQTEKLELDRKVQALEDEKKQSTNKAIEDLISFSPLQRQNSDLTLLKEQAKRVALTQSQNQQPQAPAIGQNIPPSIVANVAQTNDDFVVPMDASLGTTKEIFDDLNRTDQQAAPSQNADPNWFRSAEGEQAVQKAQADVGEARTKLMEAIRNFDRSKANPSQNPVRKADKAALHLNPKHKSRIDLLFNRRSKEGLLRISRHTKIMIEFCENYKDAQNVDFRKLNESTFDLNKSMISTVTQGDNINEELKKALEYLKIYLDYLEPRLKEVADDLKKKNEEHDKILDAQKDAKIQADFIEDKRKNGYITKTEALAAIEFKENVLKDILTQVRKPKASELVSIKSVGAIENFDALQSRIDELTKEINASTDGWFKKPGDFAMIEIIVDELNNGKYKPAVRGIVINPKLALKA